MSRNALARLALSSIAAALFSAPSAHAQSIWYVDSKAAPGGDGSTWASALNLLQPALDGAASTDQIWVAAGTYHPTLRSNAADPRSARFSFTRVLRLFGGFEGTETALDERDPSLFDDTILSGDLGIAGDASDNAYRVVELLGFPVPGFALLYGFRITGGNSASNGGGILARITGTYFNPGLKLIDCTLNDNYALRGGAIASMDFANVHLTRCTVEGNVAQLRGGAIYARTGSVLAVNTRFSYNKSGNQGGALFAYSQVQGMVRFSNCVFTGNRARLGGVAYLDASQFTSGVAAWYDCTFVQNEATQTGGVLYAVTDTPVPAKVDLYNSILWNNAAPANPSIFGTGLDVRFSDVEAGYPGIGNLDVDPLFVTSDRTGAASPVDDAGSNALIPPDYLDIDGDGDKDEPLPFDVLGANRRIDDPMAPDTGAGSAPVVDMGAYEVDPAHG